MIAKFADELMNLAANLERRGDDFAWASVRRFGEALRELGGGVLMRRVIDRAITQHDPGTITAVLTVWDGIEGWSA